jgi:ATP-dependent Clp protease ATP-binding subunit ClpC
MKNTSIGVSIAWQIAAEEASAAKYEFIETSHILIGVLSIEKLLTARNPKIMDNTAFSIVESEWQKTSTIFTNLNIDIVEFRRKLRIILGNKNHTSQEAVIHRSNACKAVFVKAGLIALTENIGLNDLLTAIFEVNDPVIATTIRDLGKTTDAVLQEIRKIITPLPKELYINNFGRDLTDEARKGNLKPAIGRKKELLQIIQTLSRQTKNNPILVGEPGVGKSAIVETLAIRIAQGKEKEILGNKILFELDVSSIVGGTKYRGELEERLHNILSEAENTENLILFIDEIHTIVGAGSAEGSLDIANIMKPFLARSNVPVIGATTNSEFRKYIEHDSALERRFEKIMIDEPSPEAAVEILKALKSNLETHHKVFISDEAIKSAVQYAVMYDKDHFLPDKAIDLIDKACAFGRLPYLSIIADRKNEEGDIDSSIIPQITEETVINVVSSKFGLPVEAVYSEQSSRAPENLNTLNEKLKDKIKGQDEAIDAICDKLKLSFSGLKMVRGPRAVFLFAGPTGSGKTETAKLISESLFGSNSNMIRLDMSEYAEEHTISKLIGAPPGYIGYDDEGKIFGLLKSKPYSLILLDEIEKAHPKIFDLLLQVFDEGRLTNAKGKTVDMTNSIIIMTSNILLRNSHPKIGFGDETAEKSKNDFIKSLQNIFRREFIGRIDLITEFFELGKNEFSIIFDKQFAELEAYLITNHDIELYVTNESKEKIINETYESSLGVRALNGIFEQDIKSPISNLMVCGEFKKYKKWLCLLIGNKISLVPLPEPKLI